MDKKITFDALRKMGRDLQGLGDESSMTNEDKLAHKLKRKAIIEKMKSEIGKSAKKSANDDDEKQRLVNSLNKLLNQDPE